jgi:predicted HicB family RNase H-like nuclease
MERKTKGVTVTHKTTHKKPFTLRLDDDLRERAERVARDQKRTLTSLMTYALDREVAAIESAGRKAREPVTAGSHR